MKTGSTLQQLATELDRQREAKKDYVAKPTQIMMTAEPTGSHDIGEQRLRLHMGGVGRMPINRLAQTQAAEHAKIPVRHWDRLAAVAPELLAQEFNALRPNESRLVRVLDNRIRALLSPSYRPLDNFDLAEAILPTIAQIDGLRVESCELTERKLYIKAVSERIQSRVVGDTLYWGLQISNSEVGEGSLAVVPLLFKLSCTNGATFNALANRRAHLGRRMGNDNDSEHVREFMSDEARQAEDRAFFLKVRDVVKGTLTQDGFKKMVATVEAAAQRRLPEDVKVEELSVVMLRSAGLTETDASGALQHLIRGGDLSQWGLANAVTRYAQEETVSYDRASELEAIGGDLIVAGPATWDNMVKAARVSLN